MSFREQYPLRVTLGEDGVYRWSADADLSRDHFSRDYLLKILLITCGIVCAITLIAMFSAGDFTFWWIPVAICVAVVAIGMLGYRIYRGVIDDRLRVTPCCFAYISGRILSVNKDQGDRPNPVKDRGRCDI